jgi:hypothetical protein
MEKLAEIETDLTMHGGLANCDEIRSLLKRKWSSAWTPPGPNHGTWKTFWTNYYVLFTTQGNGTVTATDISSVKTNFGGFGLRGAQIEEYFNNLPALKKCCIKVSIDSLQSLRTQGKAKVDGWDVIPVDYSESVSTPLR